MDKYDFPLCIMKRKAKE